MLVHAFAACWLALSFTSTDGSLQTSETRYSAQCPAKVFYATQEHALVLRFPMHRVIAKLPPYAKTGKWRIDYHAPNKFLVLQMKGMPVGEKITVQVEEHPALRES